MEFLHEPDGTVHFVHDSNIYVMNKECNGELTMSCAMWTKCPSLITIHHNNVRRIKEHCHIPDDNKVLSVRFMKSLRIYVLEDNQKLTDVYKEFVRLHPEAENHFKSLHSLKNAMGKARSYRPSVGYATVYNEPVGKIHCTFENYIYRLTKKYPLFGFVKCVIKGCPGRAVIHRGSIRLTNRHNHKSSRRRIEKLQFMKELKYRSTVTKDSLSRIFHRVSLKHPSGSKGISFSSVKFHMMRARLIQQVTQPFVWYIPLNHGKKKRIVRTSSPVNTSVFSDFHSEHSSIRVTRSLKRQQLNDYKSANLSLLPTVRDQSIPHDYDQCIMPGGGEIDKLDPYLQKIPTSPNLMHLMEKFGQAKNESGSNVYTSSDSGIKVNSTRSNVYTSSDSGNKVNSTRSDVPSESKGEVREPVVEDVIEISDEEKFDIDMVKCDNEIYETCHDKESAASADAAVNLDRTAVTAPFYTINACDANVATQTEVLAEGGETSRGRTSDVVNETLLEMHNILKKLRSERNSANDVFGKYVATSMSCMTKVNAQAARRAIIDVLNMFET